MDFSSKKGLAQKLIVSCEDCNWSYSTYLSTSIKTEQSSRYDVNVRSIIAFREIGRGLSHIETSNQIMNMPPPYTHSTYDETVKDVLPGYIAAMNDSMLGAASNVKLQASVQEFTEEDTEIPDNQDESDTLLHNIYDCDVSLDGSWQRREYASLNGFVPAIERVSDKVVDIDIMTKDCRSCKYWNGKEEEPGHEKWLLSHKCTINHERFSGKLMVL